MKSEAKRTKRLTKAEVEQLQSQLPHRYGWPWYGWARSFYESRNRQCFLCAANQISKSSTQVRKVIEWATNEKLWPQLWKTKPRQFWYLYPNKDTATAEFDMKWVPEFMPREGLKDHPQCGWTAHYEGKKIHHVTFNSGVTIFFKTYSQNAKDLQSGTVHYIATDEELPIEYYDELMQRLAAVDGYFSMVFTATLNQPFWKEVIEDSGERERFPDAFKLQVTKYDCITYEDGTPGAYTEEKIGREIAMCRSKTEVLRRIYGRFVTEHGRKYPAFEYAEHMIKPDRELIRGWDTYVGIDIGTGGVNNHPAAIAFIAVDPKREKGIVYDGWRGDNETTTSKDIVNKYFELKEHNKVEPVQIFYDWHARDFSIIAERAGIILTKPNKSHEVGEDVMNTLFKNRMLLVFETEELRKLGGELATVMVSTKKDKARDDFTDAVRYPSVGIPWNWQAIRTDFETAPIKKMVDSRALTGAEYAKWVDCQRKKIPYDEIDKEENYGEKEGWSQLSEQIEEFNEQFEY